MSGICAEARNRVLGILRELKAKYGGDTLYLYYTEYGHIWNVLVDLEPVSRILGEKKADELIKALEIMDIEDCLPDEIEGYKIDVLV